MPMDRPIPAFYCCYLLRSTKRQSSVYVGSTPNPVRRLGQHNGLKKGGAVRTSRQSLRPWEMTCIVTGFPSHIAALQFEWAWQNPHVTLHIPPELRIQPATSKKRSGQPKRPKHTVATLLSNLHLLLRVPSFSRWPLELRFFSENVYKAWVKWCEVATEPIRDSINIIRDFEPQTACISDVQRDSKATDSPRGVEAIGTDYVGFKDHIKKAKEIVDFEQEDSCSICKSVLERAEGIYAICPSPGCKSVTHITCLSNHFLAEDDESLVPINGVCPNCKSDLTWLDIVRELSLRMRGQKEVENLLKVRKARKVKTLPISQPITESDTENEEEDMLKEHNIADEDICGDNQDRLDDSYSSATESITSHSSPTSNYGFHASQPKDLEVVIEDSDWEDAEVIE